MQCASEAIDAIFAVAPPEIAASFGAAQVLSTRQCTCGQYDTKVAADVFGPLQSVIDLNCLVDADAAEDAMVDLYPSVTDALRAKMASLPKLACSVLGCVAAAQDGM